MVWNGFTAFRDVLMLLLHEGAEMFVINVSDSARIAG
jgi:hypothetical protein